MSVTTATTTSEFGGFLEPALAAPIFERAARTSVVQRLARQVPLGANGQKIPVVTGRPTVGWVGEGERKPVTSGTIGLKTIQPHKAAAIVVVSAEVVRANPGGYVTRIRPQLGEAFGLAFDLGAMYDKGPDGADGGGPFETNLAATTKAVELGSTPRDEGGIHGDLVAALEVLVTDGKRLTGWALDDRAEPLIEGAVDLNGRPLYVDLATDDASAALARPGRLMRRPSFMGEGLSQEVAGTRTLGFAGDWSQVVWGVVGGITYDVSTQTAVTINGVLISLWEHNLVAIRAEAEYGFLVADTEAFVALNEPTAVA